MTYIDGQAFVKVGRFTYLCVGDEEEVKNSTPAELAKQVQASMAISDYRSILKGKGYILH